MKKCATDSDINQLIKLVYSLSAEEAAFGEYARRYLIKQLRRGKIPILESDSFTGGLPAKKHSGINKNMPIHIGNVQSLQYYLENKGNSIVLYNDISKNKLTIIDDTSAFLYCIEAMDGFFKNFRNDNFFGDVDIDDRLDIYTGVIDILGALFRIENYPPKSISIAHGLFRFSLEANENNHIAKYNEYATRIMMEPNEITNSDVFLAALQELMKEENLSNTSMTDLICDFIGELAYKRIIKLPENS
jgi:hypothetical protein